MKKQGIEGWKDIVGYEGLYRVSDTGRVQRNRRILSLGNQKYPRIRLSKNGVVHEKLVHRIVLESWVGPCPNGYESCHKNDDPWDNRVDNLYWGTRSDNRNDRFKNNISSGEKRIKRSDGIEFKSISDAARAMGCSRPNISHALAGRIKLACGYSWRCCNE